MSATAVRVRARLFAIQRELAGTRDVALELAPNATVEDGWAALVERYPILAPGRPSVRFARNGEYVDAGEPLGDGDELAVIPPVSGGAGTSSDNSQEDGKPGARHRILELRAEAFGLAIIAQLADSLRSWVSWAGLGKRRVRLLPGRRRRRLATRMARSNRSSTRRTLRWPAGRSRTSHRRSSNDSTCAAWRSSIERGRSHSARSASRSWPSPRTGMRRLLPHAMRSTRPRPGRRSGRLSASPMGTSG
ncbi:MAG: MoaD/ThiS family protein [Chloroflexi bacterium]|nr:MAG: MoaD/ThiS family protein [Chloroflexota bacterium]